MQHAGQQTQKDSKMGGKICISCKKLIKFLISIREGHSDLFPWSQKPGCATVGSSNSVLENCL